VLQSQLVEKEDGTLMGGDLWRVGFHVNAIRAVSLLSGYVEVHDTVWLPKEEALVFVVTNRDTSGTLFRRGVLHGNPIGGFRPSKQPLMVEWPRGHVFGKGGN